MNHVTRLTWNQSLQQYVPAPETARGRHQGGKTKRKLIATAVAAALMGGAAGTYALPVGGQVSSGSGAMAQNGTTLTVNQSSQNLSLNWQSFNIAGNETVNFMQPNASAIALNRVLGSDPSAIYGKLNANGQVFLINPNGILFGQGAQVNVGGLVASTLNLSDADFMAGKRAFTGGGSADSAAVTNLGNIAANGGYIAFLGGKVSNQGTLQANLGTVALAAGNQTTLDFAGDKLIKVQVDQGALNALAENGQLIQADGGTVILTAKAANSLVSAVVNNTGLIRAQTLTNHDGVISLLGDMQSGQVKVGGTLDASAPNGGNGGFIETSAAQVNVANDAKVTTAASMGLAGTWLIDPHDFTVAASGGDITGAALGSDLGATNITLQSSGGRATG
ncbi:MAG: filamentous hemagglutinin N-terminal domain-containing protein, partial [Burkholderiales bacterium]